MTNDKLPEDATHELQNVTTHEVSLVDKPANKKPFLIVKSEQHVAAAPAEPSMVEKFAQSLAALGKDATVEDLQNFVLSVAESVGIDKMDESTEEVFEAAAEEAVEEIVSEPAEVAKDESDAPAEEQDEAVVVEEDTLAKLDSIMADLDAEVEIEASAEAPVADDSAVIDALSQAHIASLTAELALAKNTLALAQAELEAHQISATAIQEEAVAKALSDAQEEHNLAIEAKDAEIAELTTKLAGQATQLAKAEKRLGAAPQARRVSALLKGRKTRTPAADSQVVPAGEQEVEKSSAKDPWKAVEFDIAEDSSK